MAHILLLAEPSLTIQRVVQLTFANEDIDVVVASDGAEAVEQAERLRPSIVLADVALARMNGYEVAAHFKRHPRFSGVPVVLLSGAFERVDTARAAESGCDLVLTKPFEPRHLLAHVRGLLPSAAAAVTADDMARGGEVRTTRPGFTSAAPPSGHAASFDPHPTTGRVPDVESPPWPPAASDDALFHFQTPAPAPVAPSAFDLAWPAPQAPAPVVDVPAAPATPTPAAAPAPRNPPAPVRAAEAPAPPAPLPRGLAGWMRDDPADEPRARRPVEPSPVVEPVPSFEMLALTNKSMRLVPQPTAEEEPEPGPELEAYAAAPVAEAAPGSYFQGNDLGDLMPALDDYFDQLDAAFASGPDTAFRRPPDAAPDPVMPLPVARVPVTQPAPPAPVAAPKPTPPLQPPAAQRRPAPPVPDPVEERPAAVSPFTTLRLDPPDPRPAAVPPPSIDDAYDALMKQLQEPKARPSVVALRADDELLVERAVERVLAQLDAAALRDAMIDVVTKLAKTVIADEIERIRRP